MNLIEYKSGPGATVCDYVNNDGKAFGNLVRELVSRDLAALIEENKTLANLQWRCEQPPANLQELVRSCLMSDIGKAELEKIGFVGAKTLFPLDGLMNEANFVSKMIVNIDLHFNTIFKTYP